MKEQTGSMLIKELAEEIVKQQAFIEWNPYGRDVSDRIRLVSQLMNELEERLRKQQNE